MLQWIFGIRIEAVHVLAPVYAVAGIVLLFLLVPVPGVLVGGRRWWPVAAAAAGVGALAGSVAVWIVIDVQDVFGAPASAVIRGAAAATGAGLGLAIVNLIRTRWWRKAVAVIAVPAVLLAGALMINRDVAYYPTFGDFIGVTGVGPLKPGSSNRADTSIGNWRPPPGMASTGTTSTVSIPGVDSHWRARDAWVYQPPAALVPNPPRLPVVIAFAGQPGGPSDVFVAGNLAAVMDAIAARHHGVAPIVVVPDQLGSYNVNPECENSKMGNVAQYVTDDVRDWTLQHLPVSRDRRDWTLAGFSEGGTCAVQFGTEYPAIFGSYLAISPELGPINGTVARSVREAFHGSIAEWRAAQPIAIMQRKRPYRHTFALYATGIFDTRYGKDAVALATASRAAGMRTAFTRLPGVAHNWNTGAAGLRWGVSRLVSWWGLP